MVQKKEEAKQETPQIKPEDVQPEFKKYDKDELNKVFDQLLFEGEYSEEMIIRNKLRITFRSRSAEETMSISRMLDAAEYKLITTMHEQRAFNNIVHSLVTYQGKDLSKMTSDEKTKFIRRLPTSIISGMVDSLAEFDRKVDLACRDAENSF